MTLAGTWECTAHEADMSGDYSAEFVVTYANDRTYALRGWYEGEFWGAPTPRTDYVERGTYSVDDAISLQPSYQSPSLGLGGYRVRVIHLDQRTSRARNVTFGIDYECERRAP